MRCLLRPAEMRRPRRAGVAAISVLVLLLAACGEEEGQTSGAPAGGPAPPGVTVVVVERSTVDVFEDYAGRVRGSREVQVRAQVEGILEERLYNEGQVVATGASLFRIDAQPFRVALQSAQAEHDRATASLRRAERQWERVERLFSRGTISESERDSSLAEVELSSAQVAIASAAVRRAELQLGYTNVTAPVSGVTSLEAVPEGSLLERGALLTTILQKDPVHVSFALPEGDAALQRTALRAMAGFSANGASKRQARLIRPDGAVYALPGEIDFTASAIDPATGTVSARAVFPNPDGDLVPGQFVRVRLLLQTLDNVVLAPEVAVGEGASGPRVFVVGEDNVAQSVSVRLGPVVDAGQVILEGLAGGERVIVEGQVAVRPGMRVEPTERRRDGGAAGDG